MSTKSLTFDIYGRDRSASKTMRKVGDEAEDVGKTFKGMGTLVTAGLAVAGAAVISFGASSVQAYAEAEEAQKRLEYAFEKFPALADSNIEAFRKLNTEIARKTKYDDDAIATGQAVLAQFNLTGQQILELTPILADYASMTGKDMPTAAEDLGKAMLGNAKALKEVGIKYQSTGDAAADFTNIFGLMQEKVGGFAEKEGDTAAGKLEIIKNQFGEMQEAVGEKLLGPLSDVMDELMDSGAVEDLGTALGDVVQAFSDLEKKTGFFSDFIEEMSHFDHMVKDFQKLGDWWNRGGLVEDDTVDEMNDNIIKQGGALGGMVSWSRDMANAMDDFFGSDKPDMKTQMEDAMNQARTGMGGGMTAMRGDMDLFNTDMTAKWGSTWSNADGTTRTGVGNVAASTGAGLLDTLGRVLGFSGQVGPPVGAAWAGANAETTSGWDKIQGSTADGVSKVGGEVGKIGTAVRSPFLGVGSWLETAGEDMIGHLIGGIRSMIGAAGRAASDVMETIAGVIPHSPAKWGPFSGSGWQAVADGGAALREQFMSGFADIGTDIGAGMDLDTAMGSSRLGSLSAGPAQFTVVLESRGGVDLTQYITAKIVERDEAAARQVRAGMSK